MRVPPAPSSRILAFQLHAGCSGRCVLDGFGLTPDGWKTSRTATRSVYSLTRFIHRSVKHFQPSAIVLGVSRRRAAADTDLRRRAFDALRPLGLPVVVRHMREAYQLFRGRVRGDQREELARTIAVNFLPDLEPTFSPKRVRVARSAWHALALALVELIHRFPRAATALATPRAFSARPFRAAIATAEATNHPDSV